MRSIYRRLLRFALPTALGFGLVIGLVWAMVLRENATRKLYLQFEAYRASTALLEAYRDEGSASLIGGPVLGFGIYDGTGAPLIAQGSAPARLEEAARGPIEFRPGPSGKSTELLRTLGAELQGLRGMMGQSMTGPGMMGQGFGGGENLRGRRLRQNESSNPENSAPPEAEFPLLARLPRVLWLEYDSASSSSGPLLFLGASLISLALLALYVLLLFLYRKNTELRETESRSRELIQLGEAARTLVHEIKNPLGIIRVQAAGLRRRADDSAAVGRAAEIIEEEVLRLASLADRIREFLKGGQGEFQTLELGSFLESFADRYRSEASQTAARVLLVSPDAVARVRADPELLSRALDNLVRNALEAEPTGAVELGLAGRGRMWEIEVADRGPGITPENEARLFEPFFTTKQKGSGIGLALARRIAEGAGGSLTYRRRPGGGALFTLALPAV